jgi:hypothetical protein
MRQSHRILLVLLIAVGSALVLSALVPTHARAANIYIDGLWDIQDDKVFTGDTITVKGDIWIRHGGSLTLRDSTLEVDSRDGDIKTITVNASGNLYVYHSTIKNRFNYRYFFNVYNDTVFKDSTVQQLFGWDQNPGGIRLLGGSSHLFDHCTITNSSTYGIFTRRPVILNETTFSWCDWADLQIGTSGQLDDMSFVVRNCTFLGWDQQHFGVGVYAPDGYSGQFRRYLNVSYCTFTHHSYGLILSSDWGNGALSANNNYFDQCSYGSYIVVNSVAVQMHNNRYKVAYGGVGMYLYQGSYGSMTVSHEDYRAAYEDTGYGIILEGIGSVHHRLVDVSIWHTYYGITSAFGPVEVRDSYLATTGVNFDVSGGSEMDIYTTQHKMGSGFVEDSGGRITAWQRLNISRVRWSDGTAITDGLVHLLNETDHDIGTINLTDEWRFLDFKRWEVKRSYSWVNERVFAALLDIDTYFRAPELDIMVTGPQEIVFTDDYVPRLTADGMSAGMYFDTWDIALAGGVVERGRGLDRVETTIDGGAHWAYAQVVGERWTSTYSRLPDGLYDVSIRAIDRAGNKAQLDFPKVIVDTHPPFIDIYTEVPAATNVSRLHLEGRTEGGATIFIGNMVVRPDAAGYFRFDYPLVEGANGLVLLAKDRVGNTNQTVMSVILDTIPPTLTVTSPPDGLYTRDTGVFLSGRTEDDATVTVDGVRVNVVRGSFTRQLTLAEGRWDIVVRATDVAGNSQSRTLTVTVDISPPMLAIDTPAGGRADTAEDKYFITGRTDPDIGNVYINGENRTTLPGEFAIEVPLLEGANSFKFVAMDRAGNRAEVTVVITKDTQPPQYTIEVTARNGTITPVGTERYSSTDTVTLHVDVNEEAIFTVGQVDHQGSGVLAFDVTLREGRNDIAVEVKDARNNIAPRFQYTVWYDPVPPNLVISKPISGSKTSSPEVVIAGATDDGQNKVWVNNVPAGVRADGTFEITLPLDWGENKFALRAKDKAGNERTASLTVIREEAKTVQKSPVAGYAAFLVVGLVIGFVVMFALARSKSGGKGPEGRSDGPPPPKAPPSPPPASPPKGGWEEM